MQSLCIVCHKSRVPNYFLIKCISCARFWHHRCHSPPISDSELVSIIRAFNDARARNSDAVLNWKCGACRKVKRDPVDPAPKPRTASSKDDPIVVDDDDEVVEIIHPPVKRQDSSKPTASHSKKNTSAKFAQPVRIIDDPIDFLISPSADRPTSHVQRSRSSTLTSGIGQLTVSDNQQGLRERTYDESTPPPISRNRERESTPSHPHEYPQAQLKTSENQQTPLPSSGARPGSPHQGSVDQPSSLTVPPALSPPPVGASRTSPGTNDRPFLERWSMITVQLRQSDHTPPSREPEPLFHPALLPHHINSQYRNSTRESESDKKTDAWYLAALKKSKVRDAGSAQAQSTEANPASDPSHRRWNKRRPVHHGVIHDMVHPSNADDQHPSKAPFYFSVNTWKKQNEDALALFEAIA